MSEELFFLLIFYAVANACTLSKEGLLDCGSSRGRTETVFMYKCRDNVNTLLKIVFCRVQT